MKCLLAVQTDYVKNSRLSVVIGWNSEDPTRRLSSDVDPPFSPSAVLSADRFADFHHTSFTHCYVKLITLIEIAVLCCVCVLFLNFRIAACLN